MLFDADNLARLAADVGLREVQVKRTAGTASFAYIASSLISAEGSYRWGQWPGWRRWLDAKALQARMTRDVTSGSAQGVEIVLIARK